MKRKNREVIPKSTIEFFERGMNGHAAIEQIASLGNDYYLLKRTKGRRDLKILVADIYIAGEADIYEIAPNKNGIDCIVLIGFYNHYSSASKDLAKSMNVGLFDNREFFGAINCSDDLFLEYERKSKD